MAKQAMMYCPKCRNVGHSAMELYTEMPEVDVFRCMNSHAFQSYMELMALNPDKIKLVPREVPQPNDVKVEFWIDGEILKKFREMYPNQQNSTVSSIMSVCLYGEPVIIDGLQAQKIRKLGVRTGQEMLAALEVGKTLEDQLKTAEEKIAMMQSLFQGAGVQMPV